MGAPGFGQRLQPRGPGWRDFAGGDAAQAHQRFVHLIHALRRRPGFFAYASDGFCIQSTQVVGALRIAPAAVQHGLGTSLLQRRVIQKGVGACAENFCGHGRRRRQIAADQAHLAAFHTPQQGKPTGAVHGVVQAIIEGLFHQRVFRHFTLAGEVFQAGDLVGEHAGDQVFAFHALDLRRHLAPAGVARQRQGHAGVPAPAHAEQRRVEHGLDQQVFGSLAVEVTPYFV